MRIDESDLTLLRRAVREAGLYALDVRQTASKNAWNKGKNDPVTEADIAVNEMLHKHLIGTRPNYGWLSEETADDPVARDRERTWVVDPIDGTRAYMRDDDPYWCVGVSLVKEGKPVVSVIYAPTLDKFYEARSKGGATVNGRKINVTAENPRSRKQIIINSNLLSRMAIDNYEAVRRKPCAMLLRLALVADGTYDGVVATASKSDWDIAAGSLLVEEANGFATTKDNKDFAFNGKIPEQDSIVAGSRAMHASLIENISNIIK